MGFKEMENIIMSSTEKEKRINIDFDESLKLNSKKPPIFLSKEEFNKRVNNIKERVSFFGLPENIINNIEYKEYVNYYKESLDNYV